MRGLLIYDHSGQLVFKRHIEGAFAHALAGSGALESIGSKDSWLPSDKWNTLKSGALEGGLAFRCGGSGDLDFAVDVSIMEISEQTPARLYLFEVSWSAAPVQGHDRFRLEILRLARLACLGSLGGPLAHALNNPLATIRGFAEVLKRRFSQIDKVAYFSDKIITNSDRMRSTIEQLSLLSRPSAVDLSQTFDLHDVLRSTLGLMDEQFKMRNIDVDLRLADGNGLMQGDYAMWESFFLSLLGLSRDVFATGSEDSKKKIFLQTEVHEGEIAITYQDTAGGLPLLSSVEVCDPIDLLSRRDDASGVASFVISEVLRLHHSNLKMDTSDPESNALHITIPLRAAEGTVSGLSSERDAS